MTGRPDPQALHQPHRQHHRRRGREETAALDDDGLAPLKLDGPNRPRVIAGKTGPARYSVITWDPPLIFRLNPSATLPASP